ncbi:ATP-binding protein [Sinomicrobium weinanense]|uniref:Oxygen sensor histidine kinase NreB n=1 Tax=Sinomicrobium weinanense TaxID=2842200 RepID=A0A926JQR9_9FLAO|nr:ATP-binding protein [Sinomicrobium weinanense]MBC9795531.1 type IV pili methyl-accepting chemotaxis transducer N-terminal domain-containing protein [Sinomicrobium weinanense]MBU3123322.1 type IV pili methyl-accepting chemotaxis transducer N-terminal domain-containing protein [Sinomicrobium weinanense]
MSKTNRKYPLDQQAFKKLSRLYLIALAAIALAVVISQALIQKYLRGQENDSRIVNIAGRQRMLSQKLAKEVLSFSPENSDKENREINTRLKNTVREWSIFHRSLQEGNDSIGLPAGNSEKITLLFQQLSPHFETIREAALRAGAHIDSGSAVNMEKLQKETAVILRNEPEFLSLMDTIVYQYDKEASEKVKQLSKIEYLILFITLTILLLEFLFIFRPAAVFVKKTIARLLIAERNAQKMARNADQLSEAKERTVKELKILNYAIDQTLMFARITVDGKIVYMGEKFTRRFMPSGGDPEHMKLSGILTPVRQEQALVDNILSEHWKKGWQGEIKLTSEEDRPLWLELYLIPIDIPQDKSELLVICFDITRQKEALVEIERLNARHLSEQIGRQKIISSKIIENQENEQKRIAKDIHDGIGQMLTGLKFNIESIDPKDPEKAAIKIEHLKNLTSDIIKGVRTATFNLTPPELTDHGIIPAMTKLVQELSRLTGKDILLINKTGFNSRLHSLAEINIYRIVQEAINNAIKYADSSHIVVSLSHSEEMLSITIDDNGKGFDMDKLSKKNNGASGMGMTFMKERMEYINGRLFIHSVPEEGTRVTLNIPV